MVMDEKILILPQDKYKINNNFQSRVAVFLHLYYEDTVEKYYQYIEQIPHYIDVYITTSNKKTLELLKKYKTAGMRNFILIEGLNRGRDIGALLVTFKPYISQYEYICFTHDKKEKTAAQKSFSNQFVECIWSNLLYSEEYIENVLGLFEKNSLLGLLLPPMYIGEYSKAWLASDWGMNFENTCTLADILGVNRNLLQMEQPPSSYGTAFWARTSALRKLLLHTWEYNNFLPEPLPDDGELNHAVERIIQYVVMDAGYEYVNISSIQYAQKHIEYLQMHARETGKYINNVLGVRCLHEFRQIEKQRDRLRNFCRHYSNIYIYGSGVYGKSCLRLLKSMGISVDAFLNSENDIDREIEGVKELSVYSINKKDNIGVILASVLKENICEMKKILNTIGVKNWIVFIAESEE